MFDNNLSKAPSAAHWILVVTPWAAVRNTLLSSQQLLAQASDHVSVLVSAGLHRFNLTGKESRHERETILSFGGGD